MPDGEEKFIRNQMLKKRGRGGTGAQQDGGVENKYGTRGGYAQ